ncbi:MAG TPA: PQQ-binding-like beta-propeller repeat protein [Tepidisphaeraceae bacterium]|nr:PQQ-binding-like beta-propeller repeat protein [Tepidisphaeraceae bacterium]
MTSSRMKQLASRTVRVLALAAAGALPVQSGALLRAQVPAQPPQPPQQVQKEAAGGINGDNFYGKEPTEGVYVRDSAGAVEKLALAQKMERLKEWSKSADLYQEVITKYADRVVPSGLDSDKKINQYTSITFGVQEKLAKWPAEGLDVYRARFETPAAAMLENARPDDAAALNKIYSVYFVTDSGKQAAIRLIDLYLERGEFPAAAWLGDRLLTLHPGLVTERPGVLYRTALAYYFAGDQTRANERVAQLKAQFPNERGTVRGKDVVLAESLEQETKAPVAGAAFASADSWPIFGGDASRGRVSSAGGKPGARLYGVALSKPSWPPQNRQQKQLLEQQFKHAVEEGQTLGIMPVTDRGELFFQDGQRAYGVSLESGVPLPGWAQSYPSGAYALQNFSGSPRARELTCTLTDHELLAIMGQADRTAQMVVGGTAQSEARLVCLDRESGREKWVATLAALPEEAKEQRTLHMGGSPLVVGENVLVIGRAGKQAQFEDCYVLCFDLSTGKYRWSTYIASASATNMAWGMNGPVSISENTSHLAYANGRVYVQTNLGALAALDAYTGAVVWLDIYPTGRQNLDARQAFNPFVAANQIQEPPHKPWAYNPVMVQEGVVFSLPTEGHHLFIYDAGTGTEIKRIDLKEVENAARNPDGGSDTLRDLDTLVGVIGNQLILSGEKGMIMLNWKKYDRDRFDPQKDDITTWIEGMESPIRGRPFLTTDSIFVPCETRLYRVLLKTGMAAKDGGQYPVHPHVWEKPEGPGNVLVTSDHVVIAGADHVNVYTDLTLAKAKLDRELAAAPTDAQPRLRYAEVVFVAGDPEAALTKLDEATALLGGLNAIQSGAGRDRLLNDSLNFAENLAKDSTDSRHELIAKFYDRAAAAAGTPVQQVHYRLSRAKYDEGIKDPAGAVKLYQEILSDSQMRAVPQVDETSGAPIQADAVAEKRIADLIKDQPSLYEPYQQAAAAALQEAQSAKEDAAGKLLAVARTYPNSTLAGKAMVAAADAYEAAGNPRQAVRVLRDTWFKYPESPDKQRVLESVARNYLLMAAAPRTGAGDLGPIDNMEAAAAALARSAALSSEAKLDRPMKLRDGTEITAGTPVAQALDAVRKFRGQEASRSLPDFHIPKPPPRVPGVRRQWPVPFQPQDANALVVSDIKALVVPLRDFSRADRVVTWTAGEAIAVFPAGQAKPIATAKILTDAPTRCAWVGDTLLAWGGGQIASLNADNGQPGWKLALKELPSIEVARLGDGAQAIAADPQFNGMNGNINPAFIRQGRGRMMLAAQPVAAVAAPAPARLPVGEQITDVRPVGDHVLVSTSTGRVLAVELSTGKIAWQTRLSDRPVDRLAANEDFTVVRVSDEGTVRIAAFDTATGQLRSTHSWVLQNGMVPVNMALAADGTLVYTMPDRLCLKDLYKPWGDAPEKEVQANAGLPPFGGATQPDQLLISEGRILALADNGSEKYVRVHSLETGQPVPLRYRSPQGDQDVDRILSAGKSWSVSLRVVGPHLYVVGPEAAISYNLDRPAETWTSTVDPPLNGGDVFIGQDFLVLLDQAPDDTDNPTGPPAPQPAAQPGAAPAPQPGAAPAPQPGAGPAPQPGAGPAPQPGIVPAPPPVPIQPVNPAGAADAPPATQYRLQVFGRYPVSETNPVESGRLDFVKKVTDPAGINPTWQATDGGFYYLTADNKLHMLQGSRQK